MNADRLLALYEKVAEAPDAVPRLRRFVLDLAVRGKLVAQEAGDEPASELLKRIAAEKARLVKAGEIRKPKPTAPIDPAELPISVPSHWAWVRLCDMGRLSGGMTPSKNQPDYWEGDVVWLSPKDIKADEVSNSELKITTKGLNETRLELFPEGSLFIVARSGILKRTFPVAINRIPAASNQDLKVLVPYLKGQERYLQIMFRGMTDFLLTELVKQGTTVQSLKYAEFEVQPFPLPPLAEQRRIVAKVEELMALLDRLEAARTAREATRDRLTAASLARLTSTETAPDADPAGALPAEGSTGSASGTATTGDSFPANARFALATLPALTTRPDQIKPLRQTILNLAVRGKLVDQDPTDEPASELLRRIASQRAQLAKDGEIGKQKPLPELEATDLPFSAPEGWTWCRLGSLVLASDAGWSPKTESHAREGDAWGVLKVSAVSWDYFDPDANKQVLPGTEPRLQSQVHKDDFLISRANTAELVARAVLVLEEPRNLMMSDKIVRLRLGTECDHRFAWLANNYADYARDYYATNATGVSPSMKNVSRAVILNLPIPLPPLAEQHRIVAKVDALMALCARLEAALTTADTTRARLLEALLHEALDPAAEAVTEAAE